MINFGYVGKRKSSSMFLLTILLLSIGLNTYGTTACADKDTSVQQNSGYDKLIEAHKKSEANVNDISKKAFEENVKAQLTSRGFDTTGFEENTFDGNQEIRLIVQLEKAAAVEELSDPTGSKASVQSIEQATDNVIENQSTIKKKVEALTGNKSERAFGYLINGFSIDAKYKDVDAIKSIHGVTTVTAAKVYHPTAIDSNQLASVQQVWENYKLKGEGMVVSIIDSGIDPTHKDLRLSEETKEKISLQVGEQSAKNFGYGQAFTRKVPYGHNYADNNEDIIDTNPGTGMHGMHVAGIVAANGIGDDPAKAVLGVAPEAQILAMKVFPNNKRLATALDDDIIAAIEDSVKLGADVLNMSLGSVSGIVDPDSPEQLVIRQAAEAGVLSVLSAGNSSISTTDNINVEPQNKLGTIDTGTLGSPGVTKEALTVASSENKYITSGGLIVQLVDKNGTKQPYHMETSTSPSGAIVFSNPTTESIDLLKQTTDLIDVGIGAESDYQSKDVQGKIALINRGKINFSEKQRNAKEHGAIAAFIYNNVSNNPPMEIQVENLNYLTLSLTKEDGEALVKLAKKNTKQRFSFDIGEFQFTNPKTGKMSDFSSWGLTPNLEFKPEISAPGGNIYSTVNDNQYKTMSGTSMSAPFVAGSQALIYQALKDGKTSLSGTNLTRFAKVSVMNTALPMLDKSHNEVIISPRRQGAGQIKVDKAIENTTSLTNAVDGEGALALKQVGQETTFSVKLKNNGNKEATYQFTDFGGVYKEAQTSTAEVYETKIENAKIIASKNKVTVQPGQTQMIQFQLSLPDSLTKQQFVEGYIGFTSDTQPDLTMPFVGFYGDYSLAPVIDAPSYDSSSIQGFGFFTDKNNTFLGLKNNAIDPDLVAISPNKDGRKDEAKPTLNFLRNAKSVTYEIVDSDKKVIRRLAEEKEIRKDTFNFGMGRFTSHTITSANWDGTTFNLKTGKNEVVPDGQYQMKVVAKADIADAKPQEMYLPIKVDTVEPTIDQIAFDNSNTTAKLNVNLTDELSGVDLRAVTVSVNGRIETYDLSNQTSGSVSITLVASQQPSEGQNQVELLITDYAGNYAYRNQLIQHGKKAGLVLFNLFENQVITSNTANFSITNQTMLIKGSYPQELFVNGVKAKKNEQLFEVAVPVTNDTKIIVFSMDSEGQTIIKKVPITVYSELPELFITDPIEENSITNQSTYTLNGTTGKTTKKLEIEQTSSQKVDLTSLIQADGHFKTDIELVHGQNLITIYATDGNGNQTIKKRIITTSSYQQREILVLENINVGNITIIGAGNPDYDLETETYTIKGRLREKVDYFTINKQDVSYNPKTLTFSFPIKLKQGKQSLAFYIQSDQKNNGNPLVNEGYYVVVDTVLPTLQMDNLTIDERGNYSVYTNENPFHLKGSTSDNFSGYKLFVNNENIYTDVNYNTFDEKFFADRPAAEFDYEVPVTEGENHLQVGLIDSIGNKTSRAISVFYSNQAPRVPIVTANNKTLTNKAVRLKSTAEPKTKIYYSFDNKSYELYTDEISVVTNQKVYFYAVDQYGNKSKITIYEVNNIQNSIAAKPIITIKNKMLSKNATFSAQVLITYDKELTEEQNHYTHLRYSLDKGISYQSYTMPFEQTKATEMWAQSYDEAGNESEIVKIVISFPETEKPTDSTENTKPDKSSTETPISTNKLNESKSSEQVQQTETLSEDPPIAQGAISSSVKSCEITAQSKKDHSIYPKTGESQNNETRLIGIALVLLVCGYFVKRKRKY